jgi:hypothetical protein
MHASQYITPVPGAKFRVSGSCSSFRFPFALNPARGLRHREP